MIVLASQQKGTLISTSSVSHRGDTIKRSNSGSCDNRIEVGVIAKEPYELVAAVVEVEVVAAAAAVVVATTSLPGPTM